ncbi:hypothetical protein [Kineococcus aurantiacus]|uniref:hypothetical protein n=1 Tax=Kineococcus aurantiacus TaxID=37633 RepID=UPI0031D81971
MEEPHLQSIQVRLADHLVPLHFLRLAAGPALDGFPGAEPLCTTDGHLLAAHRGQTLLEFNRQHGLLQAPLWPTRLSIDAKRCRRALARAHSGWSGTIRGDLVAMDDLLFDAAASLNEPSAAEAISDRGGFHGLHAYVWGQVDQPPAVNRRLWWWDQQMHWLNAHTRVLDPHHGRPAHRR